MIENLYVFRTDEKGEKRSGTSTTCIRYVTDTCIIIYSKTPHYVIPINKEKVILPLSFSNFNIPMTNSLNMNSIEVDIIINLLKHKHQIRKIINKQYANERTFRAIDSS